MLAICSCSVGRMNSFSRRGNLIWWTVDVGLFDGSFVAVEESTFDLTSSVSTSYIKHSASINPCDWCWSVCFTCLFPMHRTYIDPAQRGHSRSKWTTADISHTHHTTPHHTTPHCTYSLVSVLGNTLTIILYHHALVIVTDTKHQRNPATGYIVQELVLYI